ncbi:hypothetical protein FOA43_001096 [Brettanomyces nanus]|uniref:Uncharacterized protein n=1 Tax=Eeniella nana TaxID=13502 RepID=A0A875S0Z2_EENNA|nr:uncharacterized protein FOA43_001096 [Brettanomyces nanus]QPG73782.1 hypothetical protein FOA43_001096 [Brettanomyces nanus]
MSSHDMMSSDMLKPPFVNRPRHRHRRSAAISGDFDMREFGLLPPPATFRDGSMPQSIPASPTRQRTEINATHITASDMDTTVAFSPLTSTFLPPPLVFSPEASDIPVASSSSLSSPLSRPVLSFVTQSTSSDTPKSLPGSPARFFMTEEACFSRHSDVPDAVIDLDEVLAKKRFSSSIPKLNHFPNTCMRTASAPELELFYYPKHSLLCSPKKSEVAIVEEITEEEDGDPDPGMIVVTGIDHEDAKSSGSNSSTASTTKSCFGDPVLTSTSLAKSLSLKSALLTNGNASSNSLCSDKSGISQMHSLNNAASASSLRGKVRYQSYFHNQQKMSSPKLGPVRPPPRSAGRMLDSPAQRSRSPTRVRFQEPRSHPKNPFRYQSQVYEVVEEDHLFENDERGDQENQSSSILSSISSKFHHRRGSSVFSFRSLRKERSVIETTTDSLLGLGSMESPEIATAAYSPPADTTLLSDEVTLTPETLGEPGPMVERNGEKSPLSNISNTPGKLKGVVGLESQQFDGNRQRSASTKRRKGIFSWMLRAKN